MIKGLKSCGQGFRSVNKLSLKMDSGSPFLNPPAIISIPSLQSLSLVPKESEGLHCISKWKGI